MSKKQLTIKELEEQRDEVQRKLDKAFAKDRKKKNALLLGRCFAGEISAYGKVSSQRYGRVIGFEDGWLKLFAFEVCPNELQVCPCARWRYQWGREITLAAFKKAWLRALSKIREDANKAIEWEEER